jgi:hypothetical protein
MENEEQYVLGRTFSANVRYVLSDS